MVIPSLLLLKLSNQRKLFQNSTDNLSSISFLKMKSGTITTLKLKFEKQANGKKPRCQTSIKPFLSEAVVFYQFFSTKTAWRFSHVSRTLSDLKSTWMRTTKLQDNCTLTMVRLMNSRTQQMGMLGFNLAIGVISSRRKT